MASIKNLKKDVDYLIEAVCSDCYITAILNPEIDNDKIAGIISNALTMRSEMYDKINRPGELKDKKETGKYYNGLKSEIIERVDKMFEDLSSLIKG